MKKGIDVSKHDGVIDWQKARNSGFVDFAIMRAGYGRLIEQKDKKFEANYQGCKGNGIPCGAYWYSYAHSVAEIQTEARVFLEVIKGKQFEYPVYLDFEEKSQFNLGKAKCTEMAKAFLEILENAGYYAGLYSSKSHLENYFSEDILRNYTVWVAHYGVSKTSYKYPFDMWQYSSDGSVPGINHRCDMNYCYKEDFPEVIKNAGLNGFTKQEVSVPEQPEKAKKKVTIIFEDKKYSGLLEEN